MQNIDEFFKNQLNKHEINPSDAAWKKIAAASASQNNRKAIIPMYSATMKRVAAAIALFLITGGAWIYMRPGNELIESNVPIASSGSGHTDPTEKLYEKTTENNAADSIQINRKEENKSGIKSEQPSTKPSQKSRQHRKEIPFRTNRSEMQYAVLERLPTLQPEKLRGTIQLPAVYLNPSAMQFDDFDLYISAEELLYAAENLQMDDLEPSNIEDLNLKQRLINKARTKLNDWAETAGLPFRQFADISEIEIQY
jgi:hypothetical protein